MGHVLGHMLDQMLDQVLDHMLDHVLDQMIIGLITITLQFYKTGLISYNFFIVLNKLQKVKKDFCTIFQLFLPSNLSILKYHLKKNFFITGIIFKQLKLYAEKFYTLRLFILVLKGYIRKIYNK